MNRLMNKLAILNSKSSFLSSYKNFFDIYDVAYRGDRRGQHIEASNVAPSRHSHHRNYPLPLPPMSDVVTSSMRNRNRYNRKKQPVSTRIYIK